MSKFYDPSCCRIIRVEAFLSPYQDDQCSINGYGRAYGLDYGGTISKGMRQLGHTMGNVSSFQISPQFSRRNKIFRYGKHNATGCSTKIFEGYSFSMDTSCTSLKILEKVLCGKSYEYPVCPETVEVAYKPPCGGTIIDCGTRITYTKYGVDLSSVTLTLKDGTPLVKGVDYTADDFSICFLKTITIDIKDHVKISYGFDRGYKCVQSFSDLTDECFTLDAFGCDAHHPEIRYHYHIPKLQFDPSDFNLIGDDFFEVTLSGQILPKNKFDLKDSEQSQYFQWYELGEPTRKGQTKGV